MVSGAFIAAAVLKSGVRSFRIGQIHSPGADFKVGPWFDYLLRFAVPVQVAVLITWWFSQVISADPYTWWNPFAPDSVGTCLFQWTLVLTVFMAANRFLVTRTLGK